MRLILALTVFSALIFSGCDDGPDTKLCVANVPLLQQKCYNMAHDYDSNWMLKPGAVPEIRQYKSAAEMLAALNKTTNTDPDGWGNFKAWLNDEMENQCH